MAPSMLASSIFLPVMALLLPFSPTIAFHTSPLTSSASSSRLYKSSSPSDSSDESISRREFNAFGFALALGLPAASMNSMYTRTPSDYPLWPLLPVGPYKRKKTIFNTVVPDSIYTLEQKFGILNVQVPIRSTIVALKGGGLFVYDPVAPTKEATAMIDDLVKKHGPVKHVVLGSVAIEHKVYAGIFSQKYPEAAVWVQPGQYAFPNDLPLEFVGFPRGTRMIPSSMDPEVYPEDWKRSGLEYATLGPFISRDGAFGETVFYHGPTKTLLVTDTVVEVSKEVPAIFADDPAPLLYHARDTVSDIVEDSEDVRQRGWMRIVLFGLFFNPKDIDVKETDVALRERRPDINPDFAGIYPWVGFLFCLQYSLSCMQVHFFIFFNCLINCIGLGGRQGCLFF
uniref:Metallo-beta-lactamase domain-containing protein n=1 Tax=Corethron hystrix TaxID=216773 RepID=A0A6U5IZN7_9STRA|mmetsp:Transcript_35371/g.82009  ORF Transcript_35371/g.82009 Transcript_35371/m.82009 type:complete len:397 (+) Transcript_35371:134-1324(+)